MNKIKTFLQENYMFLLSYIVLVMILTHPLPYYIYKGGGILPVSDKVSVSNKTESKGSYNMCYVSELQATVSSYLLSYIVPKWDVVSKSEITINTDETDKEISLRDRIYLEQANNNAIISAFRSSNNKYEIVANDIVILGKISEANTDIKIGDKLLAIDNKNITNMDDITDYINTKEVGDILVLKVINNNKEYTRKVEVLDIDNSKKIGLLLDEVVSYKTEKEVKLNFKNSEGGPSGGLMLSLALYDYLIEEDLSKGLKISGTGTIDINGNIGSIGGVKYKLDGAVKKKSDIFFIPNGENYEEAIKLKEKNKYKIDIVGVSTLDDAISYLRSR